MRRCSGAPVASAGLGTVESFSGKWLIAEGISPSEAFVARDAVAMAIEIAEAAVKAHPKGNYILALGDEGANVAQEEKQGYYKVLKPYLDSGDIKIVSEQFNKNWSTESGRAQVENALTKTNDDVVAVLAGNDGVAYGAIQALQARGAAQPPATFAALGSTDLLFLAGGGIIGHPSGAKASVQSLVEAWQAAVEGIPLEDHARTRPAPREALAAFGSRAKG